MFRKQLNNINVWQFESLAAYKNIIHFVTGRQGGVSSGKCSGLNMSTKVNDLPENVILNRKRLAEKSEFDCE